MHLISTDMVKMMTDYEFKVLLSVIRLSDFGKNTGVHSSDVFLDIEDPSIPYLAIHHAIDSLADKGIISSYPDDDENKFLIRLNADLLKDHYAVIDDKVVSAFSPFPSPDNERHGLFFATAKNDIKDT